MKKSIFFATALLATSLLTSHSVLAQTTPEDQQIAKEESAADSTKDRPEWSDKLKEKYKLTDAQIQTMKDKGISYPQMAMTATLAEKSGKSIDDILKMRTESHMGWGKIAKELGVAPKEIGQSVAGLHHDIENEKKDDRKAEKLDRKEARLARKEEKLEKKEAKLEARRERQEQKHSGKSH